MEGYLEIFYISLVTLGSIGIWVLVQFWLMEKLGGGKGTALTGVIVFSLFIGVAGYYKQQQIDTEKQKTEASNGTR